MWFEAMPSRGGHSRWFIHLVIKLLQEEHRTRGLLLKNPFPHHPPRFVRALYYRYSYGKDKWWDRELVGEYLSPLSLEHDAIKLIQARYERNL